VAQPTPVPAPTRRRVLAGFAAALVTAGVGGCSDRGSRPRPSPVPSPPPDPDAGLRASVVADKQALLERYAATARRHPRLAGRLGPLRADHDAHLAALGGRPGPAATGSAAPTVPPVPADPRAAVRALEQAEHAAAASRIAQCVRAVDGELAALIASLGACEAVHATMLRAGAR
jgi:hypothetical protein